MKQFWLVQYYLAIVVFDNSRCRIKLFILFYFTKDTPYTTLSTISFYGLMYIVKELSFLVIFCYMPYIQF